MPDFIEAFDDRFHRLLHGSARIDLIWTGGRWCEGPAYLPAGRYLVWSDIPNDRVLRWDETSGAVSVFEQPCRHQNGHTVDGQGRLVACEHGGRCVSRTEPNGSRTVLADRFEGRRLNSPNDVVVKSDGSIWFTDPRFGILSYYEGHVDTAELPMNVYRVDGQSGAVTVVADGINAPNGLAFSPDESKLYIVESRSEPRRILAYDVVGDGTRLANGRVLIDAGPDGTPDGFRCDTDGNLWCGWGMTPELDGVRVFNPAGAPIGHVALPERCANLCFGGRYRNRLFMAASHSLYALYVNAQGAPGG
jgi:gluconolactonase